MLLIYCNYLYILNILYIKNVFDLLNKDWFKMAFFPTSFRSGLSSVAKFLSKLSKKPTPKVESTKLQFNQIVNEVLCLNNGTQSSRLPQPITNLVVQYTGTLPSSESIRRDECIRKSERLHTDLVGFQGSLYCSSHDRRIFHIIFRVNRLYNSSLRGGLGRITNAMFSLNDVEEMAKLFNKIEHKLRIYRTGEWDQEDRELMGIQELVQFTMDNFKKSKQPFMDAILNPSLHEYLRFVGINPNGYPADYRDFTPEIRDKFLVDLAYESHRQRKMAVKANIDIEDELAKIKSSDGEDVFPFESPFLKPMDIVCEYMAERWTTDEVEVLTTIESSEGNLVFSHKELDIVSGYLRA